MNQITVKKIQAFEESLYVNEKSKATVSKYLRAVRKLAEYLHGEELTRPRLLEYREILQSRVKAQTVNGYIFRTRSGRPLDRTNICHDMKKLCARMDSRKIFPHNLRHLFARSFYTVEKNLAHLAAILGHSRIETTRIYVAASAAAHERILNKMRLIL